MNFKESLKYLNSFVNFEKKAFSAENFSLDKVRFLLKILRVDYPRLKYVHIAGTKGKGSTAQFCASILAHSGYKTGLYTSPHLIDVRERIQVLSGSKARLIPRKKFAAIIAHFKPLLEKIRKKNFSFFEIYTALALQYFIDQKVDFVVLETGLGGRVDATNVVTPLVSVITPIDYDHMAILGKSLKKIAYEKGGIIKKGVPVVSACQAIEAARVIKARALAQQASLSILGKDFFSDNIAAHCYGVTYNYVSNSFNINKLTAKMSGRCQADNSALAITVLRVLERAFLCRRLNYRKGIRAARVPARFEVVCKKPLTVLDVAHNTVSFKALAESIKKYFPGKKIVLIFAAADDKDFRTMLHLLKYERLILCGFSHPRCLAPEKIKKIFPEGRLTKNIREAYALAKSFYRKDDLIVVAGSFFLAGEFLKLKRYKPHDR